MSPSKKYRTPTTNVKTTIEKNQNTSGQELTSANSLSAQYNSSTINSTGPTPQLLGMDGNTNQSSNNGNQSGMSNSNSKGGRPPM